MAEALRLVLLWLGLAAMAGAATDERVIQQLDIEQPRTFGYHIGDRFSRVVRLELRAPYALAIEALPAAGRLSEFLALAAPQVSTEKIAGATRYQIRFDYQVVNVGAQADAIAVPHHELQYSDGKESLKALIPATRIRVTPLRAAGDDKLQDDEAPRPLAFDGTRLWAYGTTLALAVLALVGVQGGLPSWRAARPFAIAQRAVHAARRRGWRDEDYDFALRAVHRAFNDTAGRTLFADTLAEFFAEHRHFTALSAPVTEFYARSRSHFFAADADAPRYAADELARLVARLRDLERGLR